MRVTEAIWELRNMGVRSYEVHISGEESLIDIENELSSICCDYIVARVPVGRLDLYELLMRNEFYFAEMMIMLERDISDVYVPERKRLINEKLALEKMNDNEFTYMLGRVKEGIYTTDRISLDRHFTKEQSANRYYYWLQDERGRGNEFYKLTFDGVYVGYLDLAKLSKDMYQDEFTGIFPEYVGKGYAMGFTTKLIDIMRMKQAKKVYGEISSNNIVSLQSRMRYGYQVSSYFYVFVRHGENR